MALEQLGNVSIINILILLTSDNVFLLLSADPQLVPTPPSVEPTLLDPNRGSPGHEIQSWATWQREYNKYLLIIFSYLFQLIRNLGPHHRQLNLPYLFKAVQDYLALEHRVHLTLTIELHIVYVDAITLMHL